MFHYTFILFFKYFIYLSLKRGERRERERERNMMCERNSNWLPLSRPQLRTWTVNQAWALAGNQANDRLVRRPVLSH